MQLKIVMSQIFQKTNQSNSVLQNVYHTDLECNLYSYPGTKFKRI